MSSPKLLSCGGACAGETAASLPGPTRGPPAGGYRGGPWRSCPAANSFIRCGRIRRGDEEGSEMPEDNRIPVGVLGATGSVGQRLHPPPRPAPVVPRDGGHRLGAFRGTAVRRGRQLGAGRGDPARGGGAPRPAHRGRPGRSHRLLRPRFERRRGGRDGLRGRGRHGRDECPQPPDGRRRAAPRPGGELRPPRAPRGTGVPAGRGGSSPTRTVRRSVSSSRSRRSTWPSACDG